jgi:hypothetical protein
MLLKTKDPDAKDVKMKIAPIILWKTHGRVGTSQCFHGNKGIVGFTRYLIDSKHIICFPPRSGLKIRALLAVAPLGLIPSPLRPYWALQFTPMEGGNAAFGANPPGIWRKMWCILPQ